MALSSLNIRLILNDKQFQSGLMRAQKKMARFGKSMAKVGSNLSRSLTMPLLALGAGATKVFADFEQEMANVKAVSGATDAQFKSLSDTAKKLGATTRYSASEVASLAVNYAKLGFVPDEINKIAGATLNLAQASGEDLAEAAEVAGSTLRAFGIEAGKMGHLTDVMASAFSNSALDLQKFKVGMAPVAPVAKALGQSLEQTTAQLAILANNGIEASTSGTMLRNMMLKATKDGFSMDEALAAIATSSDKAGTALQYFDSRAVPVALTLANNRDGINELSEAFRIADGDAKKMAAIMDNTLQGSLLRLKSALEAAAIEIGTVLAPIIKSISKSIGEFAGWFVTLSSATKKTIMFFVGLVAALGPTLFIIGKMSTMMSSLVGGVRMLTAAQLKLNLAFLANPMTYVVLAIAGLVAGIVYLINKVGGISNAWVIMKATAVATFQTVKAYYNALLDTIIITAKAIGKAMLAPYKALAQAIKGNFAGAKTTMIEAFVDPALQIAAVWKDNTTKVKGYWGEVANLTKGFLKQASATDKATKSQKEFNKVIASPTKTTKSGGGGSGRSKSSVSAVSGKSASPFTAMAADVGAGAMMMETNTGRYIDALVTFADKSKLIAEDFNANVVPMIKQGISNMAGAFGEGIGNMINGGGDMTTLMGGMINVMADFAKQLGGMLIGIAVARITLDLAIKSVGGALLAIAAGTALIALATTAKNFVSNGMQFANGTPSAAGGMALVGERGPEMVNMPRGASVMNATRTANMFGGGGGGVLSTIISGNDLRIILNRTDSLNKRR